VAEAKRLLAEAGYPDGKGFPKITFGLNSGAGHEPIAEALQQMWKEIWVLKLNPGSGMECIPAVTKRRRYNINRNGWIGDYMDPSTFMDIFTTGNGQNNAMYSNPKYDELISAARRETDPAKRIQMYHDAEKILMDDAAIAPLYFYTDPIVISPNLKGVLHSQLGFVIFKWAYFE